MVEGRNRGVGGALAREAALEVNGEALPVNPVHAVRAARDAAPDRNSGTWQGEDFVECRRINGERQRWSGKNDPRLGLRVLLCLACNIRSGRRGRRVEMNDG